MKELFESQHYLFIFAHPDDEVYSSIFLKRLLDQGKSVDVAYITSGDSGGNPTVREQELHAVYALLGLPCEHIHLLRTSEKNIFSDVSTVVSAGVAIARKQDIDCVVGQDYEGGHEGHDIASFCAQEIVHTLRVPNYFVFPIYHGKPAERKGARFKPLRNDELILSLTSEESAIKKEILRIYSSQQGHFNGLQESSKDYQDLLFSREQFVKIIEPIDFSEKPLSVIGYEYHRNGFTFEKFQDALQEYRLNK